MFDLIIGNPPWFQFPAARACALAVRQSYLGPGEHLRPLHPGRPRIGAPRGSSGLCDAPVHETTGRTSRGSADTYWIWEGWNTWRWSENFHCSPTPARPHNFWWCAEGSPMMGGSPTAIRTPATGFRRLLFSENPAALRDALAGGETLYRFGYHARTGTVQWDQHKAALCQRPTDTTVAMVWSEHLGAWPRVNPQDGRPAYIEPGPMRPLVGPAIVANRVLGAMGVGTLRCSFIPTGERFIGENHVNVIAPHGHFPPAVGWKELLGALRGEETVRALRMLTGNAQLSAVELTHLLPLAVG